MSDKDNHTSLLVRSLSKVKTGALLVLSVFDHIDLLLNVVHVQLIRCLLTAMLFPAEDKIKQLYTVPCLHQSSKGDIGLFCPVILTTVLFLSSKNVEKYSGKKKELTGLIFFVSAHISMSEALIMVLVIIYLSLLNELLPVISWF